MVNSISKISDHTVGQHKEEVKHMFTYMAKNNEEKKLCKVESPEALEENWASKGSNLNQSKEAREENEEKRNKFHASITPCNFDEGHNAADSST